MIQLGDGLTQKACSDGVWKIIPFGDSMSYSSMMIQMKCIINGITDGAGM